MEVKKTEPGVTEAVTPKVVALERMEKLRVTCRYRLGVGAEGKDVSLPRPGSV